MQTIKAALLITWLLLKAAIILALLFLLFRWVDFSVWQSVVLTLLVFIGYESYLTLKGKVSKGNSFEPFRVVVLPKFDELLLDYKLLKDRASVEKLYSIWKKKDQRLIAFSVLKYQASGDPLVYSDMDHSFVGKVEIEEPIPAVLFRDVFDKGESEHVCLRNPDALDHDWHHRSPSIYLRQGFDGYELGLTVEQDWWDQLCKAHPTEEFAKTKVDNNHLIGDARLIIALIPYSAFAIFYTGENYEQFDKVWDEMDAKLARYGWRRQKEDPNAEVHDPWVRIEHKYFQVQYKEI